MNGKGDLGNMSGSASLKTCKPGRAVNSDSSFSENVPSGGSLPLPDIDVLNSAGTLIDTVPGMKDVTAPDGTVKNTQGTTILSAKSGVDNMLPNNNLLDTYGNTVSFPAGIDIQATQVIKTYAYPIRTGVTSSLRIGDDLWVRQNYFANLPSGKMPRLIDFYNLKSEANNENSFGHYKRFTGSTGGYVIEGTASYRSVTGDVTTQALAFPDNYIIDHYTGLGWNGLLQTASNWETAIDNALAATVAGLSGWFLPDVNHLLSRRQYQTLNSLRYLPFSVASEVTLWTSTTQAGTPTFAIILNTSQRVDAFNKTSSLSYQLCRKHF